MTQNVKELRPDQWSVSQVLRALMLDGDKIKNLVVAVEFEDGTLDTISSRMRTRDYCLLAAMIRRRELLHFGLDDG